MCPTTKPLIATIIEQLNVGTKNYYSLTLTNRQGNGSHIIQNVAGYECVFTRDDTRNEFCEWLSTKDHAEKCIVLTHITFKAATVILCYNSDLKIHDASSTTRPPPIRNI